MNNSLLLLTDNSRLKVTPRVRPRVTIINCKFKLLSADEILLCQTYSVLKCWEMPADNLSVMLFLFQFLDYFVIWSARALLMCAEWGWKGSLLATQNHLNQSGNANRKDIFGYLNSLPPEPRGVLANLLNVWYANGSKMEDWNNNRTITATKWNALACSFTCTFRKYRYPSSNSCIFLSFRQNRANLTIVVCKTSPWSPSYQQLFDFCFSHIVDWHTLRAIC